jgi:PAS domain S-box-containing protein
MGTDPIRALLIEDDPDDVILLKASLAKTKSVQIKLAQTDHLSSGLIQLAEQVYDVILLDLNLPDSRGLDTLTTIINGFPKIPVVVLSGLGDDFTTLEAIRQGAQDYLVKGEIGGSMLVRILRYAIERKQAEETLRAERDFSAQVMDTMGQGLTVTNAEECFEYVNPAFARMIGSTPEELLGKRLQDYCTDADLPELESVHPRRLNPESSTYETHLCHTDGHKVPVLITSVPHLHDGKVAGEIAVITNITERKQAEEDIHRQLNRLAALHEIDITIAGNTDMQLVLNMILMQTAALLSVDSANILLLDPHKQILNYYAGRGFRTDTLQHTHLRLGESYAGRAAMSRQLVHIPNLQGRTTDFLRSPTFSQEGFVCYFGIPLIAKSEVKGVLEVFHRSALNPDTEWLDFLKTLAGQAALAIDSSQMFDDLQRSNLELMQAYDATIEGWSQAMDLRDKETQGHTLRVAEYTVRLARAISMREDEIVHVRRGALLHDIGKLGVPDTILFKPSRPTEEEWGILRQHPQFAHDMLSPIAYLRLALDIPYCHHEKWDGTGYPRGLKGEQIPLPARIFSVVDVWDALISDRPYRPAWPREKALNYIREQSGKFFDPEAVNMFLRFEVSDEHTDGFTK